MAKAVIVGSGIGGLNAAIALRAKGWEVQVVERAAIGSCGKTWPSPRSGTATRWCR